MMVISIAIILLCHTKVISSIEIYEDDFLTEFMEFGRETRKVY